MKPLEKVSRRSVIGGLVGGAVAAAALRLRPWELRRFGDADAASASTQPPVPTRPFGKTGVSVSIFSLGGQATLESRFRRRQSVAIINRAIDLGVNYIDTAAAYGRGLSESYIGDVMRTRRKEVFLASKTHDRTYDGSLRLLEKSLKQLQTDRLDLWQLHDLRSQADLDLVFGRDGALRALERARDEGMVRFLGVTGHHDPLVLKVAIERHPFDAILMALNAADRHYQASFITNLLPVAVEKGMGIVAMKVPSRGKIFRPGGITSMEQAMRYVLTLPVSAAIIGISTLEELEENATIAREFRPLSGDEMANLEALTAPYYQEANWYKHKW